MQRFETRCAPDGGRMWRSEVIEASYDRLITFFAHQKYFYGIRNISVL